MGAEALSDRGLRPAASAAALVVGHSLIPDLPGSLRQRRHVNRPELTGCLRPEADLPGLGRPAGAPAQRAGFLRRRLSWADRPAGLPGGPGRRVRVPVPDLRVAEQP